MPLLVHDLPSLVKRGWFHVYDDLADAISSSPELAWRVEGTSEYLIGGYWRRRREIGSVEDLHARRNRRRLLAHMKARLREAGASLLVVGAAEQERSLGTYLSDGFGVIDEIVRYQKTDFDGPFAEASVPIRPPTPGDRQALLAVDHAAFPWLWWNSAEEFDWYLGLPGVEVYVATADDRVVAYAGITISGRQGHLDRLAILPEMQGRGYGRSLVQFVLAHMARQRVERVALTTQVDNHRSAALYARLGFNRTSIRYPIHGTWLSRAATHHLLSQPSV